MLSRAVLGLLALLAVVPSHAQMEVASNGGAEPFLPKQRNVCPPTCLADSHRSGALTACTNGGWDAGGSGVTPELAEWLASLPTPGRINRFALLGTGPACCVRELLPTMALGLHGHI